MSLVYRSDAASKGRRNSIFVGGKGDAKNREWLRQSGIDYILNVTPPKEAGIKAGVPNFFESSSKGEFHYKRIAVYDASTTNLLEHADAIVTFISKGLLHGSVLVHCQRGVSRSATSVAFYLMHKAGMTLEEAMGVMMEKRSTVNPIPAFVKQLKEYEAKCIELGAIGNKKNGNHEKGTSKRKVGADGSGGATIPIAIGPAMPPGIGSVLVLFTLSSSEKAKGIEDDATNKRRKQQTIGPAMPPAIGPAMGPYVALPSKEEDAPPKQISMGSVMHPV